MKIAVLMKFVPNIDDMKYDEETNTLVRNNIKMLLNPDDASALEYALKLKDKSPEIFIEVITMGPLSNYHMLEDIANRNVDKVILISDKIFQGSDTYATALIIKEVLKRKKIDLILGGSYTLDGDTGHVLHQIAQFLDIDSFSNILDFSLQDKEIELKISLDNSIVSLGIPKKLCILGILKESKKRLRFVKISDSKINVADKIEILSNEELKVDIDKVGIKGSMTKIKGTYIAKLQTKNKKLLKLDDFSIEFVYRYLKEKGVIS